MTIMDKVHEHFEEALEYFPENRIVGIFLHGSQNYRLDTPKSDVDTKLIVVPSVEDIVFNRKPISTTHIRKNGEHIDFKDIRLMIETFRKQNVNFLEILFTNFKMLNLEYSDEWHRLIVNAEKIARYDPQKAVKTMVGQAYNRYKKLDVTEPIKLDKYDVELQYDPKSLYHIVRIEEFLQKYTEGRSFLDCLVSNQQEVLKAIKQGLMPYKAAVKEANWAMEHIEEMANEFSEKLTTAAWTDNDSTVDEILNGVQTNIMKKALGIKGGN